MDVKQKIFTNLCDCHTRYVESVQYLHNIVINLSVYYGVAVIELRQYLTYGMQTWHDGRLKHGV